MRIVKETSRRVGSFIDYKGVCDSCQVELEYSGELVGIEISDDKFVRLVVPVDRLVCPNCNKAIELIRIYKSLDITDELEAIKEKK